MRVRPLTGVVVRLWPRAAALAVVAIATAGSALAQSGVERFERRVERLGRDLADRQREVLSVEDRLLADYGGYLSLGYYSIDDAVGRNHVLRQYELFGYARLNLDNAQEVFLRTRIGYRDFNDGDSFDGRGDEPIDGDLDRGYYRIDLGRRNPSAGRRGDGGVVIEVGRDLAYWGNGLTLAQVIDGVFVTATWGQLRLDVVGGVTPTRTVDFDSSRPQFDFDTRRGFYGAMLSTRAGAHRPYAYALVQRDYNDADSSRTGTIDTRFEYDSAYLGIGSSGTVGDRLYYGLEATLEWGRGLSNSFELQPPPDAGFPDASGLRIPVQAGQRKESVLAWAADLRVDYVLTDARRTRLSCEFIYASGDSDRFHTSNTLGGNRRGTGDHAFNGFGLVNTGLAFAPAVSNLAAARVGASTFPFAHGAPWSRLQVGADFFVLAKALADAPVDEPTDGGHYLGVEPDLFANWQVTRDVSLAIRYGVFFPGGAVLDGDSRQFLFIGMTYAF
jgi:hypothetical protein